MSQLEQKDLDFIRNDLANYELRQILGAAELVKVLDAREAGNLCSLYRDAIYLHVRNLYNFFHGVAKYDASVYRFTNHVFDVSLYIKWKDSLHTHVVHVKDSRSKTIGGLEDQQLSEVALLFTEDIEKLWQEWIETSGKNLKEHLEEGLKEAKNAAANDRKRLEELLR